MLAMQTPHALISISFLLIKKKKKKREMYFSPLYPLPAKILPLDSATVPTFEFPAFLFIFLKQFSYSSSSSPVCADDDNFHLHSFDPHSFYGALIDNSSHKRHLGQIHALLLVSRLQESRFLINSVRN